MSFITPSPPVKPFLAAFAAGIPDLEAGVRFMNDFWGVEPDIVSPDFPLVETEYYAREMGPNLIKRYLSWPLAVDPARLFEAKLWARQKEYERVVADRRLVNLDPGYISDGGLVLSTAKYRGHRLPIGSGLWAELTLHYHRRRFEGFPWTYQDYLKPEVQEYLLRMRTVHLTAVRAAALPNQ